ncbi:MAG: MBL fold metallo-hydrolase [Oscillospiraceae bacterium]|nr:MBL fold metallo-hydrolase [Oscillospiraceae bacterium]
MFWKKLAAGLLALCMLFVLVSCVDDANNGTSSSSIGSETSSGTDSSTPAETSSVSDTESVSREESAEPAGEGILAVHYLDVGQGDSVFLELPNGQCMLIDASEAIYSGRIIETIRALSYDRIDYVIATHPHADHIGGMEDVLKAFTVGCIYLPDVSASTATYIGMAETIIELDIEAKIAETGVTVLSEGDLQASFLAPSTIDPSDQNRNSAVLYLTYGSTRFLFMGDADTKVENSITGSIDCDVLKVGHHGSRTASESDFLQRCSPTYAVISCGEGNSYGHPHEEAVNRLEACGAEILRTDLSGNITIRSDGSGLTVELGGQVQEKDPTENPPENPDTTESSVESSDETSSENTESPKWILNTSTHKIHRPDCRHVDTIAEHNRMESDQTIAELLQEGYTACGTCKPSDGTE